MTYDLHKNSPKYEFFTKDYNDNRCEIFNARNESVGRLEIDSRDLDEELLFVITLDNSSNYDYFEINFNSIIVETVLPQLSGEPFRDAKNLTLSHNQHFIVRGQYVIYEFAIIRHIYYSSPFYGIFGFKANNNVILIDIDETVLASIQNTAFTVLELRYRSSYIRDEEEIYQNTGKLIN